MRESGWGINLSNHIFNYPEIKTEKKEEGGKEGKKKERKERAKKEMAHCIYLGSSNFDNKVIILIFITN